MYEHEKEQFLQKQIGKIVSEEGKEMTGPDVVTIARKAGCSPERVRQAVSEYEDFWFGDED